MVVTDCPTEFVLKNEKHVKRIISFHCRRNDKQFLDDMSQEFYLYMLKYKTLEKFKMASANPLKCREKAYVTWIYTAICNFLANQAKSKARKTEKIMIPFSTVSRSTAAKTSDPTKSSVGYLDTKASEHTASMSIYSGSFCSSEEESHELLNDFLKFIEESEDVEGLVKDRIKDTLKMTFSGMTGKQISEQIGMSSSYVSITKCAARKKWGEFERRINGEGIL